MGWFRNGAGAVMALNANCVANVTTTGSDDNAGWFDASSGDAAGGTNDRAFSNSPIIIDGSTITASVHTTTTQATLVGHTLASTDRGNVLRISGGTATAGYYRITSVDTANNRVTVDASMGASGATITGRIGGAFASPGFAAGSMVSGSTVYIKTGTYPITSTTANVTNGRINITINGDSITPCRFFGYENLYGDCPTGNARPKFEASGISATTIFTVSGYASVIGYFVVDGMSLATINGCFLNNSNNYAVNVDAKNCSGYGVFLSGSGKHKAADHCVAFGCATGFQISDGVLSNCVAISDSGAVGFYLANTGTATNCIATGGATGFRFQNGWAISCISYGCSGAGFVADDGWGSYISRCVSVACAVGFDNSSTSRKVFVWRGNAGFNTTNVSRTSTIEYGNIGFTTLTADPFVNAAGGDFSLNDVAGGGATLKALNFSLPGISTTRYPFGGWAPPRAAGPLIGRGGLIY